MEYNNYTPDSLIFDLDGTLWDSTPIVAQAWSKVLKTYPQSGFEAITPKDLKALFGRPLYTIADIMMPHLAEKERHDIIDACIAMEHTALLEDTAKTSETLFPKVRETLAELSSRYKLIIVSNCEDGYIETFLEITGLGEYFVDFTCPGHTGLVKGPNNKIVIERNQLKAPVYIGDTQGDKDSAVYAEIPFCYAAYGFTDVDGYDYKIDSFEELTKLF